VKLANADTDGAAAIFRHAVAPMSGPPLHRHSREDEWFYVLRGAIPGDRWPANCSAPGRFRFCTARHRSHLSELQRCSRGDPGFGHSGGVKQFFEDLSLFYRRRSPSSPAEIEPIAKKYGIEILEPSLS